MTTPSALGSIYTSGTFLMYAACLVNECVAAEGLIDKQLFFRTSLYVQSVLYLWTLFWRYML